MFTNGFNPKQYLFLGILQHHVLSLFLGTLGMFSSCSWVG
jgi:hypothetical protein